jgi:hypothetical protein
LRDALFGVYGAPHRDGPLSVSLWEAADIAQRWLGFQVFSFTGSVRSLWDVSKVVVACAPYTSTEPSQALPTVV